ncbi:MAG: hypothetical protein IKC94_02105 [Lentisphaeria bacterium]|nr:hypothetical protein [Lentisphaeria bacterium]
MSECPDCENKNVEAVETEKNEAAEVKAEAAEVKAEAAEVKAEATEVKSEDSEAPAAPVPAYVNVLKSIGRVVALIIILAGIGYLLLQHNIKEYWYEQCDTAPIREEITTMVTGGLGESGYTFEIAFLNDVALYEITVKDDKGAEAGKFRMYADYDVTQKSYKLMFDESQDPHSEYLWESIRRKANARPVAVPAAPAVEAPAAK